MARKPCKIGDVEFDALVVGRHRRSAQVTKHPVETGGVISDHVILDPVQLVLEVVIGSAPTDAIQERATQALLGANQGKRWEEAYNRLVAYYEAAKGLTVVLEKETYQDMVISSLETPESGDSLRASVTLDRVQFATTAVETVTLPRFSRAEKLRKGGTVSTQKPTDKQEQGVRASIALRFAQSLGAFK